MQIWRMRPDGSRQERVTHDHDFNDWFPHVSPDGKWIVIISYGLDVQPTEHPYYRHCYLRIMPVDGSAPPRVIAYAYGGQGTINVPSWSPDGTHVAFVSNSDTLATQPRYVDEANPGRRRLTTQHNPAKHAGSGAAEEAPFSRLSLPGTAASGGRRSARVRR